MRVRLEVIVEANGQVREFTEQKQEMFFTLALGGLHPPEKIADVVLVNSATTKHFFHLFQLLQEHDWVRSAKVIFEVTPAPAT